FVRVAYDLTIIDALVSHCEETSVYANFPGL
ncbi:uncharacterized protein METZ01_LOCUS367123, partial [marine metagenome]